MPTVITLGEGKVILTPGTHAYDAGDSALAIVLDPRDSQIDPEELQEKLDQYPVKDTDVVIRFLTRESLLLLIGELATILAQFDKIKENGAQSNTEEKL